MSATDCPAAPALTDAEHRRLAQALRTAALEQRAIEPLSVQRPELSVADGLRIRDLVLADRLAAGERLVGAAASTGPDGEQRLAWVTDRMVLTYGLVALGDLIEPRVEPRVGIRLTRPLHAPVEDVWQIVRAANALQLCLEVIDSHYAGGPVTAADEIADNCGTARLFLIGGVASLGPAALADGSLHQLVMLAALLTRRRGALEAGTVLVAPLHGD